MLKRVLQWGCCCCLLLFSVLLMGQEPPDSAAVSQLIQLVDDYQKRWQTDSAELYFNRILPIIDQLASVEQQAKTWSVAADLYHRQGRLEALQGAYDQGESSIEGCNTASCSALRTRLRVIYTSALNDQGRHQAARQNLETYLKQETLAAPERVQLLVVLAKTYLELGDYDAVLNAAVEAQRLNEPLNDQRTALSILYLFVNTHGYLKDWEKSLQYSREALAVARKLDSQNKLRHALYLAGDDHFEAGQVEPAIDYFTELKAISDKKSSDGYYADALVGLIRIYAQTDPPSAAPYVEEVLELLNSEQTYRIIHIRRSMYFALSTYYLAIGRGDLAHQYAKGHLRYVREHIPNDTSELVVFAFEELHKTQAAIGLYREAWHSQDTFHSLRMAMVQRNQEAATAQAAVSMDLTRNEQARREAEQATLLEQQASQARTRIFLILLGMAGVILVVMLWAYRRTQKAKQLISEKNELIEASLAEKEVLLREIHHRVKNNLQIISSLLDKQARKSSDEAVRKLVREGRERIQSMALIHQNLYESEQLSGIDIKSYLEELSGNIQKSQAMGIDEVKLELEVAEEKLDIDTAIPVGLILNELLTNCYKYAFRERTGGKIRIRFSKIQNTYSLEVRDDGVGYLPSEKPSKEHTLGLSLVNGLVRQLEGTIEWLAVERGTAVAIKF